MKLAALIASLESAPVGDGDLFGEPFRVLPYQRKFLRGAFRPGVIRAGCSLARGGGKTGLASALALDSIRPCGALHVAGGETVVLASSFQQARLTFEAVLASLELLGEREAYRIRDQQNLADIQHRKTKARLRVAGADNRRAHGWRTNLVIGDEPAQWGARGEALAAAVRTSLGKRKGARMILIGTRPASPAHFFARLLAEDDPAVYAQVHAAAPDDPPFRVSTWRKANPALDAGLPDMETLKAEARLAKRDPGELATWKALRLNAGTHDTEQAMLLDAATWAAIEGTAERAGPCIWGVDCGGSAAQSAVAGYFPLTGRLEAVAAFPTEPGLAERGLADGVGRLYQDCADRGELIQTGGAAVALAPLFAEALGRFGRPAAIAADRWREADARDALQAAGVPRCPLHLRGQGWRDGAEDVRTFRRAVLEGRVIPVMSLLIRSAMAEARVVIDAAGNAKLAKSSEGGRRARARDDAVAAAILGVAQGQRTPEAPAPQWRYRGMTG